MQQFKKEEELQRDTHQEQANVEEGSYVKKGLKVVAKLAPVIGEAAAEDYPRARPISELVGKVAEVMSDECSIM